MDGCIGGGQTPVSHDELNPCDTHKDAAHTSLLLKAQMIAALLPYVPFRTTATVDTPQNQTRVISPRANLGVFLFLFAVVLVLQAASGADHSEFAAYPDEPSHYITSLMVRDYLAHPSPWSPMDFAREYYRHYPRVALGHWPPFFYITQGLWMLLFSVSRASVRIEIAFTTALMTYLVYSEALRWFKQRNTAIVAGLLTAFLPLIQKYTDEEMSEMLLVLVCLASTICFSRYLETGNWKDSVCFGVFFSLAVLTKGTGWLLALVVPAAMLLTRRVRLLQRSSFWLWPMIVAVLCIPWQLVTMPLAVRGWAGGSLPSVQYTLASAGPLLRILISVTGAGLSTLVVIGMAVTVLLPLMRGRRVESGPAVMLSLIAAVWIFHLIVPVGVEDRKIIIAVPALVLFLFAGGQWLADRLPLPSRWSRWRRPLLAGVGALIFFTTVFEVPRLTHYGYIEASEFIASRNDLNRSTILVSSNWVGEGLLISEVAMHEHRPGNVILRATKVLAHMDWDGSTYESLFSTPDHIIHFLDQQHVNLVAIDSFRAFHDLPHNVLLNEALQDSARFEPLRTFVSDAPSGLIRLYCVKF